MIDLEGAFDAVWRNGVLYKLHKLGIKGRLWLAIHSYFHNRFTRNKINSFTSDWIPTLLGVPQGSILAVILFIIHVGDLAIDTNFNIKYADDLYVLEQDYILATAALNLQNALLSVENWCNKWRMSCSQSKTEIMVFHPKISHQTTVLFKGKPLKQVAVKRALGIQLDQHLDFRAQVARFKSVTVIL